ncbi:MAG: helix-turn-helix domain-containing protein, partial [Pseudomonadota bacterium]
PQKHDLDWHGHIEFNWLTGGSMTYQFESDRFVLPSEQLCLFWAGIPHRTVDLSPRDSAAYDITNMYYPLDSFLSFRGIGGIQRALLGGAVLTLPVGLANAGIMERWLEDYRTGDQNRFDCLTMELNALMRRLSLEESIVNLRRPDEPISNKEVRSGPTAHVVNMIEAVIQNISEPLTTQDIAAGTGLNTNYASNVFRKALGITLKQFTIRMRLIRVRELLLSTDIAISDAAFRAGFSSASQFYANYKAVYGSSPGDLRER